MELSGDLERLNHLHREIRREVFADDRDDKRLWDFLERLAQEVLMLRNQVELGIGPRNTEP